MFKRPVSLMLAVLFTINVCSSGSVLAEELCAGPTGTLQVPLETDNIVEGRSSVMKDSEFVKFAASYAIFSVNRDNGLFLEDDSLNIDGMKQALRSARLPDGDVRELMITGHEEWSGLRHHCNIWGSITQKGKAPKDFYANFSIGQGAESLIFEVYDSREEMLLAGWNRAASDQPGLPQTTDASDAAQKTQADGRWAQQFTATTSQKIAIPGTGYAILVSKIVSDYAVNIAFAKIEGNRFGPSDKPELMRVGKEKFLPDYKSEIRLLKINTAYDEVTFEVTQFTAPSDSVGEVRLGRGSAVSSDQPASALLRGSDKKEQDKDHVSGTRRIDERSADRIMSRSFSVVFGDPSEDSNTYLKEAFDLIKEKAFSISASVDARYKNGSAEEPLSGTRSNNQMTTATVEVLRGGREDNTLGVDLDNILKLRNGTEVPARVIYAYESFIVNIARLLEMAQAARDRNNDAIYNSRMGVIDTIIECAVLHEIGHGFETKSGMDLRSLLNDQENIRAYMDLLGGSGRFNAFDEMPGGIEKNFVEYLADLMITSTIENGQTDTDLSPAAYSYVAHRAAHLFYILAWPNIDSYRKNSYEFQKFIWNFCRPDDADVPRPYVEPLEEFTSPELTEKITDKVIEYCGIFFDDEEGDVRAQSDQPGLAGRGRFVEDRESAPSTARGRTFAEHYSQVRSMPGTTLFEYTDYTKARYIIRSLHRHFDIVMDEGTVAAYYTSSSGDLVKVPMPAICAEALRIIEGAIANKRNARAIISEQDGSFVYGVYDNEAKQNTELARLSQNIGTPGALNIQTAGDVITLNEREGGKFEKQESPVRVASSDQPGIANDLAARSFRDKYNGFYTFPGVTVFNYTSPSGREYIVRSISRDFLNADVTGDNSVAVFEDLGAGGIVKVEAPGICRRALEIIREAVKERRSGRVVLTKNGDYHEISADMSSVPKDSYIASLDTLSPGMIYIYLKDKRPRILFETRDDGYPEGRAEGQAVSDQPGLNAAGYSQNMHGYETESWKDRPNNVSPLSGAAILEPEAAAHGVGVTRPSRELATPVSFEARAPKESEIARRILSKTDDVARETIVKHSDDRYNLLVVDDFFKPREIETHKFDGCKDNFEISAVTGKGGDLVSHIKARAAGRESRTVALVPCAYSETGGLTPAQLQDLINLGIRLVPVSTGDIRGAKLAKDERWDIFQKETIDIMLCVRRLSNDPQNPTPLSVEERLDYYLRTHFELNGLKSAVYIQAMKDGDIAQIINGYLRYRPVIAVDARADYDKIAVTLINA